MKKTGMMLFTVVITVILCSTLDANIWEWRICSLQNICVPLGGVSNPKIISCSPAVALWFTTSYALFSYTCIHWMIDRHHSYIKLCAMHSYCWCDWLDDSRPECLWCRLTSCMLSHFVSLVSHTVQQSYHSLYQLPHPHLLYLISSSSAVQPQQAVGEVRWSACTVQCQGGFMWPLVPTLPAETGSSRSAKGIKWKVKKNVKREFQCTSFVDCHQKISVYLKSYCWTHN